MKYKPYVLFGIIFILGMMLGGLLIAKVAQHRVEQAKLFITEQGFVRQMTGLLEPVSEQQQRQIEAILAPAGTRVSASFEQSRQELRSIMDEIQTELQPVLTPEQYQRLLEKRQKFRMQNP
ncbi:hypothetical protein SG34_024355 [Thalassomonas viridans]|uniref:Zinc resistance-associated protein n=1 Tax=Thalassomonas viridans TaxID=137584 RepID=A0AAE9Z1R0_9GAMM|nr:hypothetical protein [Thalassomonas viridans]WDE04434.1 hypothetical protein SG34_024355 [Thalassomonas viridans]